jgi:hypothetical protein
MTSRVKGDTVHPEGIGDDTDRISGLFIKHIDLASVGGINPSLKNRYIVPTSPTGDLKALGEVKSTLGETLKTQQAAKDQAAGQASQVLGHFVCWFIFMGQKIRPGLNLKADSEGILKP